jgi:Rrf2 family protein
MARRLGKSEAHLAKVMQRLTREGLVTSARGPRGGFSLARDAGKITLKEIYEAVEGSVETARCMFGEPVCGRRKCFLGSLVRDAGRMIDSRLSGTKLSEAVIRLEGQK